MPDPSLTPDKSLQLLVETAHAIPWTYDLNAQRFSYVGPQVETILGYPRDAWYQEGFWTDKIHQEDREWAASFYKAEAENRPNIESEYRMLTQSGRILWIQNSANVIFGASGPTHTQGFMFDITERKHIEDALNRLAEMEVGDDIDGFLRACIKDLALVCQAKYAFVGFIADQQGTQIQTQAVWEGSGYASNFKYYLKGTPCADILDRKLEIIHQDAAKLYPRDTMLADMAVDSYFGAPLIDAEGKTIGIVSVMDVLPMHPSRWVRPILGMFAKRISAEYIRHETLSELERRVQKRTAHLVEAREEAIKANNAKSEFLSRMSHELRTPLNAIIGFGHLLSEEQLTETQAEYSGEIVNASKHLLALIDEVLDLTKIESGDLDFAKENVNLHEVLTESLALLSPMARQEDISLDSPDLSETISVFVDRTKLKEIVINLLSNAIKYNKRHGRVGSEITRLNNKYVRLTISDTGAGIEKEKINLLFVPFSRLGAEHTDIEGTGVGLSISKKLIELMGGSIGVESHPGEGSIFWIDIPAGGELDEPPQRSLNAMNSGKTARFTVLYVEDNPANLRLVERILFLETDVTLFSAHTAREGIDLATRIKPDLILMDINLPGMDGYAALEVLKSNSQTAQIKVLAMSAEAAPSDIGRAMRAGFNSYITKPIRVAELRNTIRKALIE